MAEVLDLLPLSVIFFSGLMEEGMVAQLWFFIKEKLWKMEPRGRTNWRSKEKLTCNVKKLIG